MIAKDRFDTITVKQVDARWGVCHADEVTLYEYTTEAAAKHKAQQVRRMGERGGIVTGRRGLWGDRDGSVGILHQGVPRNDRQLAPGMCDPAAASARFLPDPVPLHDRVALWSER